MYIVIRAYDVTEPHEDDPMVAFDHYPVPTARTDDEAYAAPNPPAPTDLCGSRTGEKPFINDYAVDLRATPLGELLKRLLIAVDARQTEEEADLLEEVRMVFGFNRFGLDTVRR